jgi:branched-chain amino acid transport system substrate-binding protein
LGAFPQVIVEDNGFRPSQGKEIADKFLQTEKITFFTDIAFSNNASVIVTHVVAAGVIYGDANTASNY